MILRALRFYQALEFWSKLLCLFHHNKEVQPSPQTKWCRNTLQMECPKSRLSIDQVCAVLISSLCKTRDAKKLQNYYGCRTSKSKFRWLRALQDLMFLTHCFCCHSSRCLCLELFGSRSYCWHSNTRKHYQIAFQKLHFTL